MKKTLFLSLILLFTLSSFGQNLEGIRLWDKEGKFLGVTKGTVVVFQSPDMFSLVIETPGKNWSPKGFTAKKGTSQVLTVEESINWRMIEDSSRTTYLDYSDSNEGHLSLAEKDRESNQRLWSAELDSAGKVVFLRTLHDAIEKGIIEDLDSWLKMFDL